MIGTKIQGSRRGLTPDLKRSDASHSLWPVAFGGEMHQTPLWVVSQAHDPLHHQDIAANMPHKWKLDLKAVMLTLMLLVANFAIKKNMQNPGK